MFLKSLEELKVKKQVSVIQFPSFVSWSDLGEPEGPEEERESSIQRASSDRDIYSKQQLTNRRGISDDVILSENLVDILFNACCQLIISHLQHFPECSAHFTVQHSNVQGPGERNKDKDNFPHDRRSTYTDVDKRVKIRELDLSERHY